MFLVVRVYVASVAVLAWDDSLLCPARRRYHAKELVPPIIRVYWLNVDSQRVHNGLLTAARSLEAFRHLNLQPELFPLVAQKRYRLL